MLYIRVKQYIENTRRNMDLLKFSRAVIKIEDGEVDFKTVVNCFREFGIYHSSFGEWSMEFYVPVLEEKSKNRELLIRLVCIITRFNFKPVLHIIYHPDKDYDPKFYDFKSADLSQGWEYDKRFVQKFGHLLCNEALWSKVLEEYKVRTARLEEIIESSSIVSTTKGEK